MRARGGEVISAHRVDQSLLGADSVGTGSLIPTFAACGEEGTGSPSPCTGWYLGACPGILRVLEHDGLSVALMGYE